MTKSLFTTLFCMSKICFGFINATMFETIYTFSHNIWWDNSQIGLTHNLYANETKWRKFWLLDYLLRTCCFQLYLNPPLLIRCSKYGMYKIRIALNKTPHQGYLVMYMMLWFNTFLAELGDPMKAGSFSVITHSLTSCIFVALG